jgi:hypothetical protein
VQDGTSKTGTVTITSGSVYVNSYSSTSFVADYSTGDYIRVGPVSNNNIRRITSVNSTVITVSTPFTSTLIGNVHYTVPYSTEVGIATYNYVSGKIANTNLSGVKISYKNPSILGTNFYIGERVSMTDISSVNQGIYGTASFSNSSCVVLTGVTGGSFTTGFYIFGSSTLQFAAIDTIDTYPNITVTSPTGQFTTGFPVTVRAPGISSVAVLAQADLLTSDTYPNQLTQYIISPTVTITGDGIGAQAYAAVDTSINTISSINDIVVFKKGSGYTTANVKITSNNIHGSGAVATASISPARGHGFDVISELGGRYAGITVTVDTASNENFRFPIYGKYRKLGIIKNPLFDNVTINLDNFDRVKLNLTSVTGGSFSVDEVVLQSNTKATGMVIYSNSSFMELKNVRGTFSANGKYANGSTSNDNIVGLTSGTTSNVATSNVEYFQILPSAVEIVSEIKSGANGQIVQLVSNNKIRLTNVYGRFSANDTIYDPQTNAYANVVSIFISNGSVDATTNFARKFDQTLRIPLSSNTAAFTQFEVIKQETTNAYGTIISNNNEYDISYVGANGSFTAGDYVRNSTNTANGFVNFANSTYLRLTSTSGTFSSPQTIINNLNVGATISAAYRALVLNNIGGVNPFQNGLNRIIGSTSKAIATSVPANTIKYPDLVRNTGEVVYMENIAPIELSNTSKEVVKLVIKF